MGQNSSSQPSETHESAGSMNIPGSYNASAFQGASNVNIHGGTINVVGGNLINTSHTIHKRSPDEALVIEILEWLAPNINFRADQMDNIEKSSPGTGTWFLHSPLYEKWKQSRGGIILGTGMPGAGKTVLSSLIVDDLEQMPGRIGIVFAYFRYTSNVSARDILEGLVKLHLQRDDTLVTLIKDTYTRHKAQRTRPSQGELLSILREIEKVYDITFYVLDGLDEVGSDTQFDLIEVIQLLHGNFVIMTRPLDILDAIPHAVLVNVTAQDRDIELLVSQKIDRNPRFRKLLENHGCRELVSRQVLVKSNGMFLHAALQLEALQQCSTIASVQETLDRFPAKLEEMYAVTVARIERQSPEYAALAKRVLTLLLCAQAPLTVAELRYVIATDSTMHRYEGSRVVDINTLVSVCCGLVHVGKNGIVQLVHFTALDALKPIILQDPSTSHGWLAQVCMQRLVDCNITDWPMNHSLSRFEDTLKQQRFLQYSYDHWATHAKEVGTGSSAFDAVLTFLRRCTSYPCPIDLTCGYDVLSHPQGQLEQLGSLQLASRYGLPATFGDVLVKQDESNLNTVTKPLGLTALMVAAWFDQGETVQWLLQQEGLDINAPNTSGQTALMLASAKGYEAIVKQLLQLPTVREGVNMQDVTGWTALMLASWFGYSSIVKLLLACEADGTVVTKNGTTALILASWKGHVSVVDQLLEHHPSTVDVNVRNEWGLTPLLVACWNGHVPVVERLLMYPGVQVVLGDVIGLTPLAHAKRCDHRSIVNRLLGHPGMTSNAQLAEEELMPGSEFSIDDQAMAIALDPRVPLICIMGTESAKTSLLHALFTCATARTSTAVGNRIHLHTLSPDGASQVHILDLPAFENDSLDHDRNISDALVSYFSKNSGHHPHALVFAYDISQPWSRPRPLDIHNFNLLRDLCGVSYCPNLTVLTTNWNSGGGLGGSEERFMRRENELRSATRLCKLFIDGGATFKRDSEFSPRDTGTGLPSAFPSFLQLLGQTPKPLAIQTQLASSSSNGNLDAVAVQETLRRRVKERLLFQQNQLDIKIRTIERFALVLGWSGRQRLVGLLSPFVGG